ncbi:MAG TPA: phospholipase D-like domain-containing protein [Polyangiaceae bacterium]|nr:phospholipase D-like domain-containing protein [Polyangiaceae bacterium]
MMVSWLGVSLALGMVCGCGGDEGDTSSGSSGTSGGSAGSGGEGQDASVGGAAGATGGMGNSGGSRASEGGTGGSTVDAGEDAPPLPAETRAVLEVYPMDIWAQFIPKPEYQFSVTESGKPVAFGGSPIITIPLIDPGSYVVRLSAPEHRTLEVTVAFDGTGALTAAALMPSSGSADQGTSFSHEMRTYEGKNLPFHTLYLGLRHLWFSAQGRPARRGNDIQWLMDGQEAWGEVREDVVAASKRIMVSTWWWESNFELIRPDNHHTLSTTQRWPNTILGLLESSPAHKRVLVGQFWGQDSILDFMTTDSKLKGYAETAGDGFEFMGMANETKGKFLFEPSPFSFGKRVRELHPEAESRSFEPETEIASNVPSHPVDLTQWPVNVNVQHASYHQKFLVVDDSVAYVGGMNLRRVDWDTNEHLVFDHRRMKFDATQKQREEVMNKKKLPDMGPRKDYMVRIEGPAAQDVADVFQIRWAHQLSKGVTYADKSTPFTVERNLAPAGDHQVQITATLPQPFWEHAIAESWFNAISMAENYIYIEDQYFRMPMVNDLIVERMKAKPNLRLIVITKPVSEWTDPGCAWTHASHQLFKSNFPNRYMMLQLRAFDYVDVGWGWDETEVRWGDFDVHSKLMIIDDKFLSVGSCNKNNRGLVYEGELNVAVLDAAWVREARRRVFANILPEGTAPTDDVSTWWGQFEAAAAWNDTVFQNWKDEGNDISLDGAPLPAKYRPEGFVFSLEFRTVSDCLIESVGPDMVGRDD